MSKRKALHRSQGWRTAVVRAAWLFTGLSFTLAVAGAVAAQTGGRTAEVRSCQGDNGGISLPSGFCATVFADNLGHVRHMVVAPNGVLFVNTWSGRYYHNVPPPPGGLLIALKDDTGAGKADAIQRFGPDLAQGSAGGTGIGLYNGALYAEQNDKIIRYALTANALAPTGQPQVVVSGLPLTGDHPMHPFIIDRWGHLYVDIGSATNACQFDNRMPSSPGHKTCTELQTRAGTWRYDANKTDQHFSPAERYVTGLRNGEGFAFDSSGRLFATQHGRDQLGQNWSKLYRPQQSAEQPAEELVREWKGADFGWPECYYDRFQKKLVLAPEYGGNGGRAVGVCARKTPPVAAFPAHWAPNDLLIYHGTAFPTAYRGGAFLAFHGSWNRAPEPQGGYAVVFQPLKAGKAAGAFLVFADGFAGKFKEPGQAAFRPTGLAQAPDGALYISDDVHGRIWRVTYRGPLTARAAAAPTPKTLATNAEPGPPEGINPHADVNTLPLPAGATRQDVALGQRIYLGQAAGGTCSGCHGSDGRGGPQAPSLVSGRYFVGNGTFQAIKQVVTDGVPRPRDYEVPMPPKGGASLNESDITAVAAYVWAIGHAHH